MSSIKYCVDDIRVANLRMAYVGESAHSVSLVGYKNILGVEIIRKGSLYFYSINDDCIFKAYIDNAETNFTYQFENHKLYAAIYHKFLNHDRENEFNSGSLYLCSKGPYNWQNTPFYCGQMLTKQELIDKVLFGKVCYFSDAELVSSETVCDYQNPNNIEPFFITTEEEYYQYKKRRLSEVFVKTE